MCCEHWMICFIYSMYFLLVFSPCLFSIYFLRVFSTWYRNVLFKRPVLALLYFDYAPFLFACFLIFCSFFFSPFFPPFSLHFFFFFLSFFPSRHVIRAASRADMSSSDTVLVYKSTSAVRPSGHRIRLRDSFSSPQVASVYMGTRLLLSSVDGDWGKLHPSMYSQLEGTLFFSSFDISRDGFISLVVEGVVYWRKVGVVSSASVSSSP